MQAPQFNQIPPLYCINTQLQYFYTVRQTQGRVVIIMTDNIDELFARHDGAFSDATLRGY